MKIVMLCDFYSEGLQYQENLLAKYYVKHSHEVTVITSTFTSIFDYIAHKYNRRDALKVHFCEKVKIIRTPYSVNFFNKLRRLSGLYGILLEEKADLIFMHGFSLNIFDVARYKKAFENCTVIMDYHGDYSNSAKNWISLFLLHKTIRKAILYLNLKYIDRIFPVVPSSLVFLKEVYGISESRMQLLYMGGDTDLADEIKLRHDGETIRKTFNIYNDDIVIFTGGKLTSTKRTHLVIESFQLINSPKLHLIVVGDSANSDEDYKEYLAKISGNNERIHFTGWITAGNVYRFMDACDLAIFPSSQSVLWQQAICMHLPLIIGRYSKLKDGRVVEQDVDYLNLYNNIMILGKNEISSEAISKKIIELMENKPLLEAMKSGAKRTSEELLDYNVIVDKTTKFVK